jgi:hypothetical protein
MTSTFGDSHALFTRLLLGGLFVLLLQGCASSRWFGEGTPPGGLVETGFKTRLQSRTEGPLSVAVAVPTAAETLAIFGVPLESQGVQPVWVDIENRGDSLRYFLPIDLDPEYFAPFELAWKFPGLAVGESFEERGGFFRGLHIPIEIPPGSRRQGFVYTHLDRGAKAIDIEVIGAGDPRHFHFVVEVPGLRVDYLHVPWDTLFPRDAYRDLEVTELRQVLADLPCCALGGDRASAGDPLNLVIIGEPGHAMYPLIHRGWDLTETLHGAAVWETVKSSLFGSAYRHSPISPLYLFDRSQDIALQKARGSVDERNHLRLWLTPYRFEGKRVFIGQISRDIGVKLSRKTITTHKIDPEVDEARDYFVQDMLRSGFVSGFGYVAGVGAVRPEQPRFNYTEDPYWSDGRRAVIVLGDEPRPLSELRLLQWD